MWIATSRTVPAQRLVLSTSLAKRERKGVVPVGEQAARHRIDVVGEFAVDVDTATVRRVVRRNDVLQRRLQIFVRLPTSTDAVHRSGRSLRRTVQEVVLIQRLAQHEVAARRAAGVADDPRRTVLRDVARCDPRFDRVFAGRR